MGLPGLTLVIGIGLIFAFLCISIQFDDYRVNPIPFIILVEATCFSPWVIGNGISYVIMVCKGISEKEKVVLRRENVIASSKQNGCSNCYSFLFYSIPASNILT